MKAIQCQRCKAKSATWMYMPSSEDRDIFFCDDCVSRGCSCNYDERTGEEFRDERGRLLPCCEYDYRDEGFDADYWL